MKIKEPGLKRFVSLNAWLSNVLAAPMISNLVALQQGDQNNHHRTGRASEQGTKRQNFQKFPPRCNVLSYLTSVAALSALEEPSFPLPKQAPILQTLLAEAPEMGLTLQL